MAKTTDRENYFNDCFLDFSEDYIKKYYPEHISTGFENEDKYINNTLSLKIFLAIFYLFMIFISLLVLNLENNSILTP